MTDSDDIMPMLARLEAAVETGRTQREEIREALHATRNDVQSVLAQNGINLRQLLDMERRVAIVETNTQRFNAIETDLKYITKTLEILVTRYEFRPVQLITFGLAGAVMLAVLGAVLKTVVG